MHTTHPVLIAYDGSPDARAAVKVAGHLFPGAPAVVLYAREPLGAVAAHLESHPAIEELRAYDARTLDGSERVADEGAREGQGRRARRRTAGRGHRPDRCRGDRGGRRRR